MAVKVEEIPIIFNPKETEFTDFVYMSDLSTTKPWSIEDLKKRGTINLYQPNVEPNSTGGQVKTEKYESKSKKAYIKTNKHYQEKVEQQSFVLASNDNRKFTGESISDSNFAFFLNSGDHYDMFLVDSSFKIAEDHKINIISLDDALKKKKAEGKRKQVMISTFVNERNTTLDQQQHIREQEQRNEKLDNNHFGSMNGEDGGGDDDGTVDADVNRSDDTDFTDTEPEEVPQHDEDQNENGLLLSGESDFTSDSGISSDEEEDSEAKTKKEDLDLTSQPPDQPISIETIVEDITPDKIKAEEIIFYFRDVGNATYKQIKERFQNKLKKDAQVQHFKNLLKQLCVIQRKKDKNGKEIQFLKLKPR